MLITAAGPWGCGLCLALSVCDFDLMPAPVVGWALFTVMLRLACIVRVTGNIRFKTKTLCYLGMYLLSVFSATL